MINYDAFLDEFEKIAGFKERLLGAGKKMGLLEEPADAAVRYVRRTQKSLKGPNEAAKKQLHQMKLQRQLAAMKAARAAA